MSDVLVESELGQSGYLQKKMSEIFEEKNGIFLKNQCVAS